MDQVQHNHVPCAISVLIVDDSLVFRRFLRDVFAESPDFLIVGEAQNGIEALDMVLKTHPSVILLDLEMPLMDGMTALQHLMIHRPTPTIMFSSLTEEGTARAFDTMKNGAVDFICKDFIFQENSLQIEKKVLTDKTRKAAQFQVKAREPFFASVLQTEVDEVIQRVVFCEECGGREVVAYQKSQRLHSAICSQCGDSIEIGAITNSQVRRNTFISVIGGGEGSFFNLLEIIPQLPPDLNGALIAVIHQEIEHLDRFTEYLDAISAMKVIRARDGINVEGGNCYIVSGHEYMQLKPFGTKLTLQMWRKRALNCGPLDVLLVSVSSLYKKRACGITLSGDERYGDKGMSFLLKNGGTAIVLDGLECYCKNMGRFLLDKVASLKTYETQDILEKIKALHSEAKDGRVVV